MILVTVGTTAFDSLFEILDQLQLNDEILCQIGPGKYIPKNHSWFRYDDEFSKKIAFANIVVSHGGAGTLFQLLAQQKMILAVENTDRSDSHQKDLLKKLSEQKYIRWCQNLHNLESEILNLQNTPLKKYEAPLCTLPQKILNFISKED